MEATQQSRGCGGWWPVAVQCFVSGWAGRGYGAVGVQDDGPAPAVHGDQVVEGAQEHQVGQAGRAALGAGNDVVRMAGCCRLVAAGEAAAGVAYRDRAAQVHRDGFGRCADVQWQAGRRDRARRQAGSAGRTRARRALTAGRLRPDAGRRRRGRRAAAGPSSARRREDPAAGVAGTAAGTAAREAAMTSGAMISWPACGSRARRLTFRS
jgi:hypothetical protein